MDPITRTKPQPALLLDDTRFDAHVPRAYHPERPERLLAARAAAENAAKSGVVQWTSVPAREATDEELARVHAPEYLEQLAKLRGQEATLDADTYVAKGSVAAARLGAGGLVAMVDRLFDGGESTKGVALLRPPGHHARPAQAMGFCLLNNVAVAAAHARARGISRVAVIDFDVHHGNGTQEMFWDDPSVLYISTHQWPVYPGSGAANERGEGDGKGFTVNVPLSAGGGDGIYRGAFERVVLPVLDEYAPELVLVSAGFDPAHRDPLAQMEVGDRAFGWMARALADVAAKSANGRMLLALEGGYDLVALEAGLGEAIAGMMGRESPEIPRTVDDPDLNRAVRAAQKAWRLT